MRPKRLRRWGGGHVSTIPVAAIIGLIFAASLAIAETAEPSASDKPPTTVLDKENVQGVLGSEVRSLSGEDMGRIVNVIVDRVGEPRAAVIDFGGFLGVGSRKIAVDWTALHFTPEGKSKRVTLDLKRDQVKAAPEYQDGKPVVVLESSGQMLPMPGP